MQFETTRFLSVALEQMQASDGAAREALEATGLLSAEEITLIIGRRKRAAARAAIAASLENTSLLPTQKKPAEKRELTAVERNLLPPPSPGTVKREAVAEAEDRLSATLAKLALAPSNAQSPEALRVGTAVSFKLSDGSVHCGVVEKFHCEGEAYSLVEDGTGIRWQNHPARSLKARKSAAKKPIAIDADADLSFLTPAQRQKFVENEALDCLALLDDEDLEDLLEGDAAAKASFRFRYPDPSPATDAAGTTTNNPEPATTRAPVRFEVADEVPPPEPPPPPVPLPAEAPLPTKIPERPVLRVVVDANIVLDANDLTPAYLLQDCGAVRIVLPLRVAKELDGLKNNSDPEISRRARRANAFFSDPYIRRQPWLELEKGSSGARDRTADEEILDCAITAQRKEDGTTVLCTRDKNLRLRAAHADVKALDLVEARAMAHSRDVSWRRAYGHILPDSRYDDAARYAYLKNYGS